MTDDDPIVVERTTTERTGWYRHTTGKAGVDGPVTHADLRAYLEQHPEVAHVVLPDAVIDGWRTRCHEAWAERDAAVKRSTELKLDRDRLQGAFDRHVRRIVSMQDTLKEVFPEEPQALEQRCERAAAEITRLRAELKTTDQLLEERNKLLDMFYCPDHGKGCVPDAMNEVERLRARVSELEREREAAVEKLQEVTDQPNVTDLRQLTTDAAVECNCEWEQRKKADAARDAALAEVERLKSQLAGLKCQAEDDAKIAASWMREVERLKVLKAKHKRYHRQYYKLCQRMRRKLGDNPRLVVNPKTDRDVASNVWGYILDNFAVEGFDPVECIAKSMRNWCNKHRATTPALHAPRNTENGDNTADAKPLHQNAEVVPDGKAEDLDKPAPDPTPGDAPWSFVVEHEGGLVSSCCTGKVPESFLALREVAMSLGESEYCPCTRHVDDPAPSPPPARDEGLRRAVDICETVERELLSESSRLTDGYAREAMANSAGAAMCAKRLRAALAADGKGE